MVVLKRTSQRKYPEGAIVSSSTYIKDFLCMNEIGRLFVKSSIVSRILRSLYLRTNSSSSLWFNGGFTIIFSTSDPQ